MGLEALGCFHIRCSVLRHAGKHFGVPVQDIQQRKAFGMGTLQLAVVLDDGGAFLEVLSQVGIKLIHDGGNNRVGWGNSVLHSDLQKKSHQDREGQGGGV